MGSGILLVDKPGGITSHDAVARTRKAAGTRKVGHAGTLDPMATGLLVLGINSSTRLLTFVVGLDKEYLATIRLGSSTTTDDAEGSPIEVASPAAVAAISPEIVATALADFRGTISQVPSSVSAIKVDGQRAYTLARAGETVELKARTVTISALDLLDLRAGDGYLDLDVRVECSSGTYIRAIARDLGAALGIGGHLTALRRTRIGPFSVEAAVSLPERGSAEVLDVAAALLAPAEVASLLYPTWTPTAQQTVDLSHGKRVPLPDGLGDGPIAAVTGDGRLAGLVERRGSDAKVIVNFPTDEYVGNQGDSE
ncbi:tRNA pseudouridine(55) synthase TruB [Lacisediminihabitans sp. G11-30]|uniref:tRNA pseudouridine synthase B n=1 Tax=Lacisediminihabitans changchengi TaxID=2787634 RepID=A0A934SIY5_9MICO|nr:tRNA pseudouridine(55) synthase TruB [Lacisediminihabitans changchengi]